MNKRGVKAGKRNFEYEINKREQMMSMLCNEHYPLQPDGVHGLPDGGCNAIPGM
jgi:hypothetical protein